MPPQVEQDDDTVESNISYNDVSRSEPRDDEFRVSTSQTRAVARDLLIQRFSCRYFLVDKTPNLDTLKAILDMARHAPSGSNFQPWKVHVLRGASKVKVAQTITAAHKSSSELPKAPYDFYPSNEQLGKPEYRHLRDRRTIFGNNFYGPLKIRHDDKEARKAVTARNWSFFDAPVGFLITTFNNAPVGSYLDVGLFVMALIVAIRSHGLECCVQESHAVFNDLYARELNLEPIESVVCGVAVGYADMEKVHKFGGQQEKMTVEELVVYHD